MNLQLPGLRREIIANVGFVSVVLQASDPGAFRAKIRHAMSIVDDFHMGSAAWG